MILGVRHVTRYRFGAPRRALTQSLRLQPASCASQTVLNWSITCEGANFGTRFIDGAGDTLQTSTVIGRSSRSRSTSRGWSKPATARVCCAVSGKNARRWPTCATPA